MVSKKNVLFVLFVVFSFFAFADVSLKQPFAWESMGDVIKYEIKIDKFNKLRNRYESHFLHITTEEETASCKIYISPILSPGKYKATITPFNILGVKDTSFVQPFEFTIHEAGSPKLNKVVFKSTQTQTLYRDIAGASGVILIEGEHLLLPKKADDEIFYTNYFLTKGKKRITCKSASEQNPDNTFIALSFPLSELGEGKYILTAQDASGLFSEEEITLVVTNKKKLDVDLTLSYSLPILLHNKTFAESIGTRVFPGSFMFNADFFPIRKTFGNLGVGALFHYANVSKKDVDYSVEGHFIHPQVTLTYQSVRLFNRWVFGGRIGAGVSFLSNFEIEFFDFDEEILFTTAAPSFSAGFVTHFFIIKGFYASASVDYMLVLNQNNMLGFLIPSIGLGYKL